MVQLIKAACLGSLVVMLLAACGGQATVKPSSSPAATPSTSPSATALNCSLPVALAMSGPTQQGGFISLPSGTFTTDPNSGMSYDATSRRTGSTQSPVLYGDGGMTYDRPYRRWLPVSWAQVLADGSAYVYTREASPTQFRNEIHLVTVATGSDRIITNQDAYHAIAYQPEGIYVDHHLNGTDASSGLWLLDPASGSLKAYPSGQQATWARIAGGAAWSYSLTGNRFGSNAFARLDLNTGNVTTWFSVASPSPPEPGFKTIRVLGFDGSDPLVQVYIDEHTSEIWRLSAPGQATRLPDVPLGVLSPPFSVTDTHGTWLIAGDGNVYLGSGSGFTRVAAAPSGATPGAMVAGACS
jgi:hypothetical protein